MSKATRIRQQNAREKIAAQRAAARRAEVRRRALITAGSVIVVVAIVVAFIVIKASGNNSPSSTAGGITGTALPASVGKDIASVPASTLASVGTGSVPSFMASSEGGAPPLGHVTGPPLTSGGKPEMLYIGAEYCPYCAAERWAMAQALSRFGTFTTPLSGIHSSSTDVDPSTPTLTFYNAKYSSKYLVFTPVENENLSQGPLQATTSAQQALWAKYDTTNGQQGYPFVDIGNKYVIKTPTYDPGVLAKMTWAQVATALHDPSSPAAQGAIGSANLITAAICKMTNGQPGNVCTAPAVVKASGSLG